MDSFYWHDYETFGIDPMRAAPAQFAGVRTDAELNEIEPPLVVYCQPVPDLLPEPESCLLTGITPQQCAARGVPEPQFAALIDGALGRPGTVGVGYNAIRFDDTVTRFLLWRSLRDPYAREFRNGCSRWDLLDVARAAYALRPDGITWPRHDDGRVSLKLEDLARANGLAHEAAHDALSDVRATIALAKLIRRHQPRLWDFCLMLRRKDAVREQIGARRPFWHVSARYPAERGFLALVWPLAPHPTNANELIVWDLASDPAELADLSAEAVRARLFTRNEDLPPGMTRLPIKTIHINRSPVVSASLGLVSEGLQTKWGLDMALLERHALAAAQLPAHVNQLWPAVYAAPSGAARNPVDADTALYDGFIEGADRRRLDDLRALLAKEPASPQAAQISFDDARLRELALRHRARHYPATLTETERHHWKTLIQSRLCGSAASGGLPAYFHLLDQLQLAAPATPERTSLLSDLQAWGRQLAQRFDSPQLIAT